MQQSIIRFVIRAVFVLALLFGFNSFSFAQVVPPPVFEIPAPFVIPGTTKGDDTHFTITDSQYLNVTLDSSEQIKLKMDSVPEMVTLTVEPSASSTATSTQVTLSGFVASTTYYKYEDGYHNLDQFTTDVDGKYSYVQDLSKAHIVFVQPRHSTKFIKDDATGGDCTSIGSWNSVTKVCTMNVDLTETAQIDSDNITLDGNHHTITGTDTGSGIFLNGRTGVTIKNLNIKNVSGGISLYYSSGNYLIDNIISNISAGIVIAVSNENHLTGNTVINSSDGIILGGSHYNILTDNTVTDISNNGIRIDGSNHNELTETKVSISGTTYNSYGIEFGGSSINTLASSTIILLSDNSYGIFLGGSTYNKLISNTISGGSTGIILNGAADNTLISNKVISPTVINNSYGILINGSGNSTFTDNTITGRIYGIMLYGTGGNTLTGNTTSNNNYGIHLLGWDTKLTDNTISNNSYGVYIYATGSNILTNNTISNNTSYGMYFADGSSYNQIYNNNFINNSTQINNANSNPNGRVFNLDAPIGGNYWSSFDTASEGCSDANSDGFCDAPYVFNGGQDNLPWTRKDGLLGPVNQTPTPFWSEISNDSGTMMLRNGTSTSATALKQLPSGWVLKVATTTDDITKEPIVSGGYRWYGVIDATDGTKGWMAAGAVDNAGNFIEGQEYLKYDARDLSATSSVQYTTPTGRASLVLEAVDHYYKDTSTAKNLYSSADKSNISLLKNLGIYQGQPMGSIPIGVILGFFAQEDSSLITKNGPLTDKSFNNENISYDYGSGVGQITLKPLTYDHKGEYSDIKVFPCSLEGNNYIGCYAKNNPSNIHSSQRYVANPIDGNIYKFYTNTIQSIYSNVKDGLGVLSKAYDVYKTAFNENTTWTGIYKNKTPGVGGWPGNCPIINGDNSTVGINLAEMRKIVAIKGYNGTPHPRFGFVFDDGSVPEKQDCYLSLVADKVIHLNQYFPSYSIQQEELDLARKMQVVDQNKTRIDIHSPGTLRIVDGSGAVTELLADSSISAGLPNVAYSEDGKSAEVYFPDSSYIYQVVGDKAGTYGLTIANTTPDATSTVELYNVPLALGEVYTYQVDWNALAQGEKGVTIQIDKNGDGVTDDTIQAGAVVSDAIAPVTTFLISSTPGTNNWYTSDATISLTAIDNDGGVGVEKTTYSLDGGDWQTYATTTPVVISADGVHSLQYYSVDYFGNIETTSTLDFKIDATAPTIFASDTSAEQLTLDGTQLTIPVTVKDGVDTNPIFTTDVPLTQTFAPGVTNILITAHDMAGNIATSSIAVTVYSSPEADPDGDGVPNQDDVKPFDSTVFANLTIPDEYSLWEKESFDLPFSIAGKGNVTLSLSNTYYRVGASPVKDSSGGIIPATVVTLDGVISVSFPQGAKDLKTYTLTLTTTKGNTKERKSLKEKRDHESDEGRRHDLDKELDFASAPITLSITNTGANKTASQAGTVAIYDKQQTVQLQYKYKETNRSTSLLLKSDDVLKLKKGQPLELSVKVSGIKKIIPFTTNISGNFTMLSVVQEEEHKDDDNRKQTKFSLFFPQSITTNQESIIITTTVDGVTSSDVVSVKFEE